MDAYKTPDSNLSVAEPKIVKPVKGLVFSLLISIGLLTLVSSVVAIGFMIYLGVDMTDQDSFDYLYREPSYLIVDMICSLFIAWLAGRVLGRYVPGQEIKYSAILIVITMAVSVYFIFSGGLFEKLPLWYSLMIFLATPLVMFVGVTGFRRNRHET